jgi:hypothetical protein
LQYGPERRNAPAFTITLKALGCNAVNAPVNITGSPLALEAFDCTFNNITINPVSTVEVDILDNTAPDFTCPANLTLECVDGADYVAAIQTWIAAAPATATDACAGTVPVLNTWNGMDQPLVCDSLTVTFSATDSCMNTKSCIQKVYLRDTQAPTWVTMPGAFNVTLQCSDAAGLITAQAQAPVATDACDQALVPSKTAGMFVPGTQCPQAGTYTNTWTVTDDCGNTSTTFTQIITIIDTQAPTWTTPLGNLDRTVECSNSLALADAQALVPVASDNCDNDVTNIVEVAGPFAASTPCSQAGTYTNTWTVTDDCGNTSVVYTQVITVVDTQAPTWTTLPNALDITLQCDNAAGLIAAQASAPIPSDNCDVALTPVKTSGSFIQSTQCSQAGSYTNTWIVSDDCGNPSAVFTQVITIIDNTPPTWTTPLGNLDRTVECSNTVALANAQALFPVAMDNCDITVSALNKNSGAFVAGMDCLQEGTYTNTWTVTDDCGNTSSTYTQVITVVDTQAPTWISIPGTLDRTVECSDVAGLATAQMLEPIANDNCDALLQLPVKSAGVFQAGTQCAQAGTYTNVWTVTDDCGNTSTTFTQIITIQDTQAPTWTTPVGNLDRTVECSDLSALSIAQALAPVASDNCDMALTPVKTPGSPVQGAPPCIQNETITNTWTVTDDCGNTSVAYTQVITIRDTQVPTWTTVAGNLDRTVECSDAAGLAAAQSLVPVALDNCDPNINTQLVKNSGTFAAGMVCPQEGTYTNTWTVTDDCGNTSSTYTQIITVTDNTNPTALCQNTTVFLDNTGNATLAASAVNNNSSDLCDAAVSLSVSPSAFTCANVGPNTVTLTVTDDCGNVSSCMATVTVSDIIPPVAACPMNVVQVNDPGQCSAAVTFTLPASSDNCLGVMSAAVPASGSTFAVGTTTVTVTATDASNNMHSCTFTVTVNDTQAPVAACPMNVVQANDPGQCNAVVSFMLPTSSDNCPGVTSAAVPASGSTFLVGTTTVTVTATDAAMNGNSCTFTVTVNDTQAPVAACPMNVTQANDLNQCNAVVMFTLPASSDNCPGVTSAAVPASGSTFAVGTTTVTVTATDASNNIHSCTFSVTVNDTQAPVAACPSNITQANDLGQCSAVVSFMLPASSDNCPGVTSAAVPASGSTFAAGTTTVTVTATDASSNSHACTFTVTVNDTQAPVAACPMNVTQANDLGQCSAVVSFMLPASSDNCPGVTSAAVPGQRLDVPGWYNDGNGNSYGRSYEYAYLCLHGDGERHPKSCRRLPAGAFPKQHPRSVQCCCDVYASGFFGQLSGRDQRSSTCQR